MTMYSQCMFMYGYPDWGFSVLFPQLLGKCQGKTRKDGARPALFLIFVLFYVLFVLFYVFCVVLRIVCFVSFSVLYVCICVLYYCHRVATQLQLTNISYHIISYHIISYQNVNTFCSHVMNFRQVGTADCRKRKSTSLELLWYKIIPRTVRIRPEFGKLRRHNDSYWMMT
jgi:hypothetical protein